MIFITIVNIVCYHDMVYIVQLIPRANKNSHLYAIHMQWYFLSRYKNSDSDNAEFTFLSATRYARHYFINAMHCRGREISIWQ